MASKVKAKARRATFLVSLDVPEGCTLAEIEGYIREAVQTWKGQGDPDEPLYELDWRSVKVKRVKA